MKGFLKMVGCLITEAEKLRTRRKTSVFNETVTLSFKDGKIQLLQKNSVRLFVIGKVNRDLEEIVRLYEEMGKKVFYNIDGSYIVGLLDKSDNTFYLTVDPYGTKKLYYTEYEDRIVFSDSLKELFSFTAKRGLSTRGLIEYLRFLDISPPNCIFEGVRILEPGWVLIVWHGHRMELEPPSQEGKWPISPEPVETFKKLLSESIRAKTAGAKKIGAFLSGGIDSTLICSILSKIRSDITAITVGFDDGAYDEAGLTKALTDFLGIKHLVFKFDAKEDYQAFQRIVSEISQPFADPAMIPTYQTLCELQGDFDLILDGTGADTLIGIMPARHIRIILNYTSHLSERLRYLIASFLKGTGLLASYAGLFDFSSVEELLIRWKGWTSEEIKKLTGSDVSLSHTRFFRLFTENRNLNPLELYSLLIGSLPDDRVHQIARICKQEIAFPFFDRKLQAFVRSLPLKMRYRKGKEKLLYRKTLEGLVPSQLWCRPKHGFNYPFERLLKYKDYLLPRELLKKEFLDLHGFFDTSVVQSYLNKYILGDVSLRFKIWALVVFQGWYLFHYLREYRDS